jgi:hypothetical protein
MRTVEGSTTSTLVTTASSPRRFEPFMFLWRSEVVLDRCRVHLLAVVERDAAAQLDHERLVVGGPFVRSRELRHDRQLLVEIEQLVAQPREHDPADERARHRRIEDVGILRKTDAQRLRERGG